MILQYAVINDTNYRYIHWRGILLLVLQYFPLDPPPPFYHFGLESRLRTPTPSTNLRVLNEIVMNIYIELQIYSMRFSDNHIKHKNIINETIKY